jgi:nitroimidazol reductase NimA-like FMN-containing flavoprotein (pyridoxamine 5'-phosphate oxidase superfamily)
MKKTLSEQAFNDFYKKHTGWVILSSIDAAGFPHSIAIGYFMADGKVYCGTRDNTQKIRNIENNPKVSLLIESGSTMADIKGAMIQGEAKICRSPEELLHCARLAAKARGVAEADWPTEARPGAAYIEVTPVNKISWDYSG